MNILVGLAPKNHVLLAMDEVNGLIDLGCNCKTIKYGRNEPLASITKKIIGVINNSLKIVFKLYQFKPDILYLNSRFDAVSITRDFISIFIIKILYFKNIKIVIKTHGSNLYNEENSVLNKTSFFFKKTCLPYLRKNVNAWFFLSSEEIDAITLQDKKWINKMFLLPNIIETVRCSPDINYAKSLGIPEDKIKVLFSGRMTLQKGCFDVLRAISFLSNKEDYCFVFLGDGPEFDKLKEEAKILLIYQHVLFLGFIPEELSDKLYSFMDILAFPTYFNEGFPMALFKSVGVGLPIITTKIRAAKDYLCDPLNVLWVPEKNPLAIALAIERITNDKSLRESMNINNRSLAETFSKKKVTFLMKNVFESI